MCHSTGSFHNTDSDLRFFFKGPYTIICLKTIQPARTMFAECTQILTASQKGLSDLSLAIASLVNIVVANLNKNTMMLDA